MSRVILDSSALLALINDEEGADIIEQLLGNIIMSSVNVAEVASTLSMMIDDEEQVKFVIEPFINSIIEFEKTQAYIVSSLRKATKHKGLTLGDRACIALAVHLGLQVYTADKIWSELDIPNIKIHVIR